MSYLNVGSCLFAVYHSSSSNDTTVVFSCHALYRVGERPWKMERRRDQFLSSRRTERLSLPYSASPARVK
uniref:Uncharacterized protein n=1 Tax=Pristionchus pacificus TaxID=54126 RepID=A0A2A6BXC7_PRIPA|eukprot:PDM70560.1 hypothetical protein PRIPAC_46806 [Pristionchus pacificus]